MKVSEVQITNFQLQQLFEEFNPRLTADGINSKYSWFLYKNCEVMAPLYNKLMSELYDERREPDFPAMYNESQLLIEKYRDRDADGNPINPSLYFPFVILDRTDRKSAISRLVLKADREALTVPILRVPSFLCVSGAQCSPARTAIPLSFSALATSVEGTFAILKQAIAPYEG